MRQPTPFRTLYAWHRAAVAGEAPPTHDGLPEAGWYKRRWVKGGPWVPVRIYVEREIDPETRELACDEILKAEVSGVKGKNPSGHWTHLKAISSAEYDTLMHDTGADTLMAATHAQVDLSQNAILPRRKVHA